MKAEFVRFFLPFLIFLACGALEETVPQILSVGFPLLMTAAILFGGARPCAEAVLLAVAAGLLEDALGGLPLATTASFLVPAVLVARLVPLPRTVAIAAYPLYQLWLVVWTRLPAGELWGRLLVAVPLAAAAAFALAPLLLFAERRLVSDAR